MLIRLSVPGSHRLAAAATFVVVGTALLQNAAAQCSYPPPYFGPIGLVQPHATPTPNPTPIPTPTPGATPVSGASGRTGRPGLGGAGVTRRAPRTAARTYGHWVYWWHKNKDRFLARDEAAVSLDNEALARKKKDALPLIESIYHTLNARLRDPYPNVRATAAVSLGRAMCGTKFSERTVQALLARLQDTDHEIHEAALVGLAFLRDKTAIPWLRAIVEDHPDTRKLMKTRRPCFCLRSLAAFALGMIGEAEGDAATRDYLLEQAVNLEVNHNINKMAMLAIGMLEGDRVYLAPAFVRLRDIASDRSVKEYTRAHAVIAVSRLLTRNNLRPGDDTLDLLSTLMKSDPSIHVRHSAIVALGTLLDPTSYPERVAELRGVLKAAKKPSERNLAAIALARIGGKKAFRLLLNYVSKGNDQRTAYSALAIGIMCRRWLETGSEAQRSLRALGLKALRRSVDKKRAPGLRGAMAIALGIARDEGAVADLEKVLLKHRKDEVRGYAAIALGMTGAKAGVPILKKLLREKRVKSKVLRANIVMGLGLLGDRSRIDAVLGAYKDGMFAAELSAMSESLCFAADHSIVPQLRKTAINEKEHVYARAASCVALGSIGDRRACHPRALINAAGNYIASFHTWNVVNRHTY